MKYENISQVMDICDKIAGKEKLLYDIESSHQVSFRLYNGYSVFDTPLEMTVNNCGDVYEEIARKCKRLVVSELQKEIQSLHLQLAPL